MDTIYRCTQKAQKLDLREFGIYDAHVDAWMDAPCCPCGTIIAEGEKECAACKADREPALSLFEYCGR